MYEFSKKYIRTVKKKCSKKCDIISSEEKNVSKKYIRTVKKISSVRNISEQ